MKIMLSVTLLMLLGHASVYAEEQVNLFLHSSNHGDLTPKQEKVLNYIKSQEMNSKVRTVEINAHAFSAPHLILNVSPTVSLSADMKKFDSVRDTKQWFGGIADSPDSASFVIHDGNVTGTIQNADRMYSVKPIGGGLHAIIEQDPTKFPDEHPPEYNELEVLPSTEHAKPTEGNHKNNGSSNAGDRLIENSTDEISVLVVYTSAVDSVVVDPEGLIELAVKETNESYTNSSISAKVRLVGTRKVNYSESNRFSTDLARLSGRADGFMDNIHSLRDSTKADVVVLLVNTNSYCGLADAILANESSAFAVVFHGCATGYYSFGHEIGHLQGARHNPEVDNSNSPFKYGHGYILYNDKVRTVMSYNCPNGCRRLPYWSNPKVRYNGKPIGTEEKHNNSRVITETLARLGGFR